MTEIQSPTSNKRSDAPAVPAGMEWDAAEYANKDGLEEGADGTVFFADARNDAWHQLGQQFGRAMTAEELMRESLLGGWNVRKSPLQTITDDGILEIPGKYAVVRTNPVTGKSEPMPNTTVGEFYTPIQNEASCDVLQTIVDESGAIFETAGSLAGGTRTFVTMKLPETIKIGGVDDMDLYLAALNSHDGTSKFLALATPVRIVCQNTQRAALRNVRSSFAFSHTKSAQGRISQARAALRMTFAYAEAFEAEAEAMINASMSKGQFERRIKLLFPKPKSDDGDVSTRKMGSWTRKIETLSDLFMLAPTNENIRGTAWAGYNAVTEYVDHVQNVQTRGVFASAEDARAARTILGRSDDDKIAAFANFREFARA